MPHFDFPTTYALRRKLQLAINKKFLADGADSVLLPYFERAGIDFAQDILDGIAADTADTNSTLYSGDSEAATADRDNSFELAWARTLLWAQSLKVYYKTNVKDLTAWGLPVLVGGRIEYPKDFGGRAAITTAIIVKHNSYTGEDISPLKQFITTNGDNLVALLGDVVDAKAFDLVITEKKKDSEDQMAERDKKFDLPYVHVRGVGEFLKSLYPGDTTTIGFYGFDFVAEPKAASLRVVSVGPTDDKVVTGIVIGSVLENIGLFPFYMYKGKKKTGVPILVLPGEKVGMNKGFSSIVASNRNTIGIVKFTVMCS
ncbi:MAG: hypothetical protein WCN27_02905 [Alphaproteobacteria bacterium]